MSCLLPYNVVHHAGGNVRIHDLYGGAWIPQICNAHFCLKYSGTPKYGNMLGNSLPVGPAQQTTECYLKYSGWSRQRDMFTFFFQKVLPGILQVIISNSIVSLQVMLRQPSQKRKIHEVSGKELNVNNFANPTQLGTPAGKVQGCVKRDSMLLPWKFVIRLCWVHRSASERLKEAEKVLSGEIVMQKMSVESLLCSLPLTVCSRLSLEKVLLSVFAPWS